jgi:hypothetical protein
MATYKMIQDIEAEDHILGPLTLRQFIYSLFAALFAYLSVFSATHGMIWLLVVWVPPLAVLVFFAFPFGKDQPTEIWALAKIRFLFKPRVRLWDQDGVKELVTITVPKKVEHVYTDGLSQNEIRSRLNALASTIDSRGWAVKNVNINAYSPNPMVEASSDRLIDMSTIPQAVPDEPVTASDDMLDEQHSPIAQQFDTMITQSNQAHRQQLLTQLNSNSPAVPLQASVTSDPWFLGGSGPIEPTEATSNDAAVLAQSKAQRDARQVSYGHLHTLQPLSAQPSIPKPPAVTPPTDPAILSLASNNDLDVATIARQAHKATEDERNRDEDEVVISLH